MNKADFFHIHDYNTRDFEGFKLPDSWWSRHYEYPWAIQFAEPDDVVADMGCGYTFRPFKDALAKKCRKVYAIDGRKELLDQEMPANMLPLVCDLSEIMLPNGTLDKAFCISVLEEVGEWKQILGEFRRVIKPGGKLIVTFDSPYDPEKPLGQYKGLEVPEFLEAALSNGFYPNDCICGDKKNVLFHKEYNLCVFHAVLKAV